MPKLMSLLSDSQRKKLEKLAVGKKCPRCKQDTKILRRSGVDVIYERESVEGELCLCTKCKHVWFETVKINSEQLRIFSYLKKPDDGG